MYRKKKYFLRKIPKQFCIEPVFISELLPQGGIVIGANN